jgi:uncharacterized protein YhaN
MIFSEIHIDGFGIFNNFSLTRLKPGINIILGNNEAGKSTLLKFLRYTLFGYPKSTEQRMAPLNGGEHRGRIKAILSDRKIVTFERIAGSSGGNINLVYGGRSIEDQVLWSKLLGNATKEIFENVYAFSLDELTGWDQLSASGVEDKIFSVGLGLRNISINDVEANIQKQVDDIYKARGTVQKIPLILKEINTRKNRISEIQSNLPRYKDLNLGIKQLEEDIYDIEEQIKKRGIESDRLDNYLRCYESFVKIINIDRDLDLLPEFHGYPQDRVQYLMELEREEQELNDKIHGLRDGSEEEKGIKELEEEIGNISFNSAILEREDKVEFLLTNLEKYRSAITDRMDDDAKTSNLDKAIEQKLKNINAKWTEKDLVDFSDIISHQDRINNFKRGFDEIKESKIKIEGQRDALQTTGNNLNIKIIFILVSVIFIIGSITALYYSLYVLGASLAMISLIIFLLGRKSLNKESSSGNILQRITELKDREEKLKSGYEKYLAELNLQKSLSPDSVFEILRTIGQVNAEINDRDTLRRKQEEQRIPFIEKFEQEVISFRDILAVKEPADNIELIVNQIISEFNKAKEQSQNKEVLKQKLTGNQKELERTEIKLKNVRDKLTELLKSINAKDREDFKKKYEKDHRVKELLEDRKNAVVNIETVVGLNKSDNVIEFLKTRNIEDIKKENKDLDDKIEMNKLELKNKNTELGEKKNELRQIEGESELSEIMTELESERQKLHDAYKNWMAGKIAVKLLTDVKSKYEKEKQPEVIKNSNNYLCKITGHRYNKMHVSLDEREVTVFDAREASKKIEQLSRGTREQLLISLRLGFIEEYERKAEPLPVIVDEVLVNFDPSRAKRTAEVLHDFGRNRQILIFTCHPETVEFFRAKDINKLQIVEQVN